LRLAPSAFRTTPNAQHHRQQEQQQQQELSAKKKTLLSSTSITSFNSRIHPAMISRNILVGAVALCGGAAVQAFVAPAQRGVTGTLPTPLAFVTLHHQQHHVTTLRKHTAPTTTVLFMGWGPEPVWSPATIRTTQSANKSGKSVSLTVAVPPETAQAYKIPGQYVQIRLNADTKPLFLAISSAPDTENAVFEFLIKKTDDNGWMTDATAGTAMEVSQVLGGGFPMAENLDSLKFDFPTQNVLLFGVGSGIAPLKAAMESGTFVFVITSRKTNARGGGRGRPSERSIQRRGKIFLMTF
jgi:hypothetical protein